MIGYSGVHSASIIKIFDDQASPKLTRLELAEKLNCSPETIKEHLIKLHETHRLTRMGSTRYGHWQVLTRGAD